MLTLDNGLRENVNMYIRVYMVTACRTAQKRRCAEVAAASLGHRLTHHHHGEEAIRVAPRRGQRQVVRVRAVRDLRRDFAFVGGEAVRAGRPGGLLVEAYPAATTSSSSSTSAATASEAFAGNAGAGAGSVRSAAVRPLRSLPLMPTSAIS